VVVCVAYVDFSRIINRYTKGVIELAIAHAVGAKFEYEMTCAVKDLDTMVVCVCDEDVAAAVYR
jgi:hypothetical protein